MISGQLHTKDELKEIFAGHGFTRAPFFLENGALLSFQAPKEPGVR
jgi:hypothetical protein